MSRLYARSAELTGIALVLIAILPVLIAIPAATLAQEHRQTVGTRELGLVLLEQYPSPVLTAKSPGTEGNKYGFEGGNVVKLQGTYHLVTTEMTGDPLWVKTKLAHWSSNDRIHWKRISTLYESSGEFAGQDPRASLWGPMFIYDDQSQVWDLVYVAYHCAPNTKTEWRNNYEGTIWLAVSTVKGLAGIDGPYADSGVILRPDADSQPWEGLQGTDSFFPYQVGKRWLGFYGSANTEHLPMEHWRVGLAEATRLVGPWKRCTGTNPVNIEKRFAENPIVTRLDDGSYIAVYDNDYPYAIGSTWSPDGLHWMPGRSLVVQPKGKGFWADVVRTPLGLVAEGHGRYTLFYTGYQGAGPDANMKEPGFSPIGFVSVKLLPQKSAVQ